MSKSLFPVEPVLWVSLCQPRFFAERAHGNETRQLRFKGILNRPYALSVGGEFIPEVEITIVEGRHYFEGRDIIGVASHSPMYSTEESHFPLKELLRRKAEAEQAGGKGAYFEGEGLIVSAAVYLQVWMERESFETLRAIDFEKSQALFSFRCGPKVEDSMQYDSNITSWDPSKERQIECKSAFYRIDPLPEPTKALEPTRPLESAPTPFQVELLARLSRTETLIAWGLMLIGAGLLVLLFRKP